MQFWIKLCNCVLVVGLLCGYQAIQNHRTQEEEIAKLEAQLQQQAIAADAFLFIYAKQRRCCPPLDVAYHTDRTC